LAPVKARQLSFGVLTGFGATSPFARAPAKDRSPPVCDGPPTSAERLTPTLSCPFTQQRLRVKGGGSGFARTRQHHPSEPINPANSGNRLSGANSGPSPRCSRNAGAVAPRHRSWAPPQLCSTSVVLRCRLSSANRNVDIDARPRQLHQNS